MPSKEDAHPLPERPESAAVQSRSGGRRREAGGPTIVVRTYGVRLAVVTMLAGVLGLSLLVSLGFNLAYTVAYREYFQTDRNVVESFHSGVQTAADKIAIIDLSGVMISGEGHTKRQIDRVRDDESVKAVVLRVNTPGGAVTAADYLYHHLKALREDRKIPVVVSMGSVAASGGYYVSMAAGGGEKILFAEPTCVTGSIGVIIPRYDISDLLAHYHIKNDAIVSHELKGSGSWTKQMTPEERLRLQGQVDFLFGRFKDVVQEGRPMFANDQDALEQVATGEVFIGQQAKDLMLVDEIGFVEDAIERAAELAKLNKKDYRVVEYSRRPALVEAVLGEAHTPAVPLDARALTELTTPRAYYLYSWLQ